MKAKLLPLILFWFLLPDPLMALPIEQAFQTPPHTAKPHTWWHWMGGHVTKEGITQDLEAMHAIGLGGYQVFQVSIDTPQGPIRYDSKAWHEMIQHAMQESERLGLEFGFHNCAGWSSSGGPWITPEHSMKQVVWKEARVQNATEVSLPQPTTRAGFYRDIAVLAFPTPALEKKGEKPYLLDNWQQKGFHYPHAKLTITPVKLNRDTREAPENAIVPFDSIRVFDAKFKGTVFQIPSNALKGADDWTFIRFGYTTTGIQNSPAHNDGNGLECDKLDKSALDLHWDNIIQRILDNAKKHGNVFTNVLVDSFEKNYQNWTAAFPHEFKTRMGYELNPWLVALTGRIINSTDQSERFLWDMRQTIGELINENYMGHFQQKAHEHGLSLALEPYGMGNFDELGAALVCDIPMGEFWTRHDQTYKTDNTTKLAASAANITGKQFVGAEAFTSVFYTVWTNSPWRLKRAGDYHFAQGVNRFFFHSYIHQPWGDAITPGMNMGRFGFNFNRNNTWFLKSKPYIDYLSRCQYMSQEGNESIDLLYIYGENTPNISQSKAELRPKVPNGYTFQKAGYQVLAEARVDRQGNIAFKSGARFPVLIMTEIAKMRVPLAKNLLRLANAGATIVMDRPTTTPGLTNYPQANTELAQTLDTLLNKQNVLRSDQLDTALKQIGLKPNLEVKDDAIEYYRNYNDAMDWYFIANQDEQAKVADIIFRIAEGKPEIWNPETGNQLAAPLWNRTQDNRIQMQLNLDAGQSLFVVFHKEKDGLAKQAGITSAIFKPETKNHNVARSLDIRHLRERPYALFKEAGKLEVTNVSGQTRSKTIDGPAKVTHVDGPWTVQFGRYGPEKQIQFKKLTPWNEHSNKKIRYFSGTAHYQTQFSYRKDNWQGPLWLDLGEVNEIAEITLNDEPVATLWKPPYLVDVRSYLKDGMNKLTIAITNLQVNRVIGDEQHKENETDRNEKAPHPLMMEGSVKNIPDWVTANKPNPTPNRNLFYTFSFWKKDSPLLKSGLYGPVKIIKPQTLDLAKCFKD